MNKPMPSYGVQVTPVQIKMAKPPMIPQEMAMGEAQNAEAVATASTEHRKH